MKYKKIGILGGMGPEATAELYFRIIQIFQKEYGAIFDRDFPEIVILNLPLLDVVESTEQDDEIRKMLVKGVRKLSGTGVEFIVIPCNTVMSYIKDMQMAVNIPVLNLAKETTETVNNLCLNCVGLLGTEMTIKTQIYDLVLSNLLIPDQNNQIRTTEIIMNVLSGKKSEKDADDLRRMVEAMKSRGAEKVILGCTELPLLYGSKDTIDTLDVLARAAVRESVK